mgnify:CR=1 FL=1
MKRPFKRILYGGDYNPNQWGKEIWKEDMRIFKDARINSATINVFSWAKIQPSEEIYNFTELDEIIDMLSRENYDIVLATSTGALPAWMVKRYPEVARTDYEGRHHKFGQRHNACPNSPVFQKFASRLAGKLAERYGDNPHVTCWHISNEYGGECYCENCEKAFRVWLQKKYGTLDELNRVWNTAFWSHTMYDWDDVVACNMLSEEFLWDGQIRTNFQGISLDYNRFNSDSMLECFNIEKDVLKRITPDIPVTTNLMGAYKHLDYQKWAKDMDFVSWDNYPAYDAVPGDAAMNHDLMRGLKQGKPFALMEQTPGVSNWHIYCKLKRPGVMRLWSYEAVAHGADTVMFFQMRRSMGACEKYHSGVIEHVGTDDTRVFREITALGAELDKLQGVTLGARAKSDVAIVFDWDNWWAAELSAGPSKLINYTKEVSFYYRAFFQQNISVDFVSVEDDLSSYKLVVAPMLYMCKDGFDEKVREYVQQGGSFLTTYFSGYVEDHDLVTLGGYPGRLKDILGIWVEESDALPPEENNSFVYEGKQYPAGLLCDLMHLRGAKEIASYESDFYAGMPVLTENEFGKGKAYYVGARSNEEFYKKYLGDICESLGIRPVAKTPEGIEATARYNDNGEFLFLLNNTQEEKEVVMEEAGTDLLTDQVYAKGDTLTLEKYGVAIVKR